MLDSNTAVAIMSHLWGRFWAFSEAGSLRAPGTKPGTWREPLRTPGSSPRAESPPSVFQGLFLTTHTHRSYMHACIFIFETSFCTKVENSQFTKIVTNYTHHRKQRYSHVLNKKGSEEQLHQQLSHIYLENQRPGLRVPRGWCPVWLHCAHASKLVSKIKTITKK